MADDSVRLDAIRSRDWFYEFDLPDGTRTRSVLPAEILRIHATRRDKLLRIIAEHVPDAAALTAIDLACHEGYYALEMARYFRTVQGVDYRDVNIVAAREMADVVGVANVTFTVGDLQTMAPRDELRADFVLCYGLIYHLENPIHAIRLASELAGKHILIETQVFPYDITGRVEDGYYRSQRRVEGMFSLSADYAHQSTGGPSDLALVPSLNAVLFLLQTFGFRHVQVLPPEADDYEQFQRGHRVLIYGTK